MIKKRGNITVNNIVTAVIAIVCLAVLIFAIVKLYDNLKNQEMKNAQKILDNLVIKINALQSGENTQLSVPGMSEKWFIAGWSAGDAGRPEKCYLGSCICICNGLLGEGVKNGSCQSNGFCKVIPYEKVSVVTSGYISRFSPEGCKPGESIDIRLSKNLSPLTISLNGKEVKVARIFSEKECKANNFDDITQRGTVV